MSDDEQTKIFKALRLGALGPDANRLSRQMKPKSIKVDVDFSLPMLNPDRPADPEDDVIQPMTSEDIDTISKIVVGYALTLIGAVTAGRVPDDQPFSGEVKAECCESFAKHGQMLLISATLPPDHPLPESVAGEDGPKTVADILSEHDRRAVDAVALALRTQRGDALRNALGHLMTRYAASGKFNGAVIEPNTEAMRELLGAILGGDAPEVSEDN